MAQPRFSSSNEPRKQCNDQLAKVACESAEYEPPNFPFKDLEPTSRPVSGVLYAEIDELIHMLQNLDAKLLRRLAPIMRDPEPSPDACEAVPSGFAPLFDGVYSGVIAAQRLVTQIGDNLNRVDEL